MLTKREERILKVIVGEYVSTAMPVGSESIAHKHELGVSPATIRNDMACLEEEGYITHPHTSAGRIPSDKGYRYYVESLMEEMELPPPEQRTIRHLFHQVETDMEEWVQLAAAILSRVARNLALVTFPKASLSRLRHMELVTIQEFLALLIVVLKEAKLKKQILPLDQATSQEGLSMIANKLNAAFEGMTSWQIAAKRLELSPLEGGRPATV
jgi:heat-inducible transcriptional repressor